jgi:hypothetical protein
MLQSMPQNPFAFPSFSAAAAQPRVPLHPALWYGASWGIML